MINQEKGKIIKRKLQDNKGNPKFFWQIINHDILGKSKSSGNITIKNRQGQFLDGQNAAEYMNNFYAEMGDYQADDNMNTWEEADMNMPAVDGEFIIGFIEEREVKNHISKIDIHKSSGVAGINSRVLKDCMTICSIEMTYLYNVSVYSSIFPNDWKTSIVTPIPKMGSSSNVENWRPINNVCVPGKILEKLVYEKVSRYFENNRYFSNNQHGFQSGKSTHTAIMELTRVLFENLNDGKFSSCLYLDTVRHSIL